MKIETITIQRRSVRKELRELLHGKVFHVTNIYAFRLIQQSGAIRSNARLEFAQIFAQPQHSYLRNRHYISVFDFRDAKRKVLDETLEKLNFLKQEYTEHGLVFLIIATSLHEHLLLWKAVKEDIGCETFIPHVEAGINENIDIANISSAIFLNVREPTNDRFNALIDIIKKVSAEE